MPDDQEALTQATAAVREDFPTLAPHLDSSVVTYGQSQGPDDDRQLEFYHPDQPDNPNPGKNTIEVYNRDLKGQPLEEAIAGDMLHRLGVVDPEWQKLRTELGESRTEEQNKTDDEAYERDKASKVYGNLVGSKEDWDRESRLDAYVRAGVFPKSNPEWEGYLTSKQQTIIKKMRDYLQGTTEQ
jgi:hypothetical protein